MLSKQKLRAEQFQHLSLLSISAIYYAHLHKSVLLQPEKSGQLDSKHPPTWYIFAYHMWVIKSIWWKLHNENLNSSCRQRGFQADRLRLPELWLMRTYELSPHVNINTNPFKSESLDFKQLIIITLHNFCVSNVMLVHLYIFIQTLIPHIWTLTSIKLFWMSLIIKHKQRADSFSCLFFSSWLFSFAENVFSSLT